MAIITPGSTRTSTRCTTNDLHIMGMPIITLRRSFSCRMAVFATGMSKDICNGIKGCYGTGIIGNSNNLRVKESSLSFSGITPQRGKGRIYDLQDSYHPYRSYQVLFPIMGP
jgi:hypothetical protein